MGNSHEINSAIRNFFKRKGIPLKSVADALNISQANLSERLQSKRTITMDEFAALYKTFGRDFAAEMMVVIGMPSVIGEEIHELYENNTRLMRVVGKFNSLYNRQSAIISEIGGFVSIFKSDRS